MNLAWPNKEPGLAQRSPDPLEGLNQGHKGKALAAYEDCVWGDATEEQLSWTHNILTLNTGVNTVFKSLNWSFLFLFYRTCVPPPLTSLLRSKCSSS